MSLAKPIWHDELSRGHPLLRRGQNTLQNISYEEVIMGLITPEQFKESLRDGREVYMYGEEMDDLTTRRALRFCSATGALDYKVSEHP